MNHSPDPANKDKWTSELSNDATTTEVSSAISQAVDDPSFFSFTSLVRHPAVAKFSQSGPDAVMPCRLLMLFAWGNWRQYKENRSNYPQLNEAQEKKLKILSLLSIVADPERRDYETICSELELPSHGELEELFRQAVMNILLTGLLDSVNGRIELHDIVFTRDPSPNKYLAVFRNSEDASKFMRNSPIEFNFIHPIDTDDNPLAKIITEKVNELSAEEMPENEPENTSSHPGAPSKYTLRATLAVENHMQSLRRHPYWGGFNPASRKAEFQDLVQLVPHVGLADITALRGHDVSSTKVEERKFYIRNRKRLRDVMSEKDGPRTDILRKRREDASESRTDSRENLEMVD